MKIPIFKYETIQPLKYFGLTSRFWDIHIETLIFTWIAMIMIIVIIVGTRLYMRKKKLSPFLYSIEQMIEFFVDLCKESFGYFEYRYFAFVTSLFIFTFFCNVSGMLPFIKEPTEDINTALACGISAFLYVQYQKIRAIGIWNYFKGYTQPIFILLPLNIVGELAKAASMSFRLFGNILGGSIIIVIALEAVGPHRIKFMIYVAIALPLIWLIQRFVKTEKHPLLNAFIQTNNILIFSGAWLLMFFGLFEGVVQAFVITMLTVTYLSLIEHEKSDASAIREKS